MSALVHTRGGTIVTELIVEIFRLNGRLLDDGNELVRDAGLTSARWQVLGAVASSAVPLSVAHIARNMGLTRQAVQRLANELERDDLIRFSPNPHHERSRLVMLTSGGRRAFARAMERQVPWANGLARNLSASELAIAVRVLSSLRRRLEAPNQKAREEAEA